MGFRAASSYTNTQLNAISGGTTEIVLFTTAALAAAMDNAQVVLLWQVVITIGASTTSVSFQLRRGIDITGTSISAALWTVGVAAGATRVISGSDVDMPTVAEAQYSLTMQQNSGSTASTFVDGCLLSFVL